MAHVPHDAVVGRVVDVVQRNRQLYDAEARRQMAGIHRQLLNDGVPKLIAQLGKLLYGQLPQVGRIVNFI